MKTSKIFSKALAVILCVVMLMQMLPLAIFADETTPETPSEGTIETTPEDFGVNPAALDEEPGAGKDPATAAYTVEHYLQTGDGYAIDEAATETKTGEVGAATAAEAKTYEGYAAKEFAQGTVAAEGTTVVAIYYDIVVPTVTTAEYKVEHYLQTEGGYAIDEAATEVKTGEIGAATAAEAKTYEGYAAKEFAQGTVAAEGTTVVAIYYDIVVPAAKTAEYKVEHYLQTEDGYAIDEAATEVKTGEIGAATAAEAKTYEGYTADAFEQAVIAEDGTTIVKICYSKNAEEAAGNPAVDAMSDEELVEYVCALSDDELAAFVASLSEEQYQRIAALLGIEDYKDEGYINTYDTVESTLAPGVTQTINQAYRSDGGYVKYFVAVADLSNPEVGLHATYGGAQGVTPGVTKMTEQIADMTKLHSNPEDPDNYIEYYSIVAGVNGDGYDTTTGVPSGAHVMNGVSGFKIDRSQNSPWFAQFADGHIACGRNNTDWDAAVAEHGAVQEAIGGFQLLMKDGIVYEPGTAADQGGSTYWRPNFDYPCSFVGVTEDDKLILINCNGNNAGGSKGFDYNHTIEVAKDLGVKDLLCLDGGGSATYLSRPEGSTNAEVISIPSDGGERAVANGLVIYSTAAPSDVFKRAVLATEATHYTPCSEIQVTATGLSPAGNRVEIPSDVQWALADDTFGTIADGVFTSNGKTGSVKLQMVYENAVVGEVEVNIVNPTTVDFDQESMVVPYGKTAAVKMSANYYDEETGGNFPVVIKPSDFTFSFSEENAGSMNGFDLTAPEDSDKANVTLTAVYKHSEQLPEMDITVSYGKASGIVWDFEDGDVSDWMGIEQALEWVEDADLVTTSPLTSVNGNSHEKDDDGNPLYNADGTPKWNMYAGNAPGTNTAYTFLATAENGQVKNGNYALGFTMDETSYDEYGSWEYNILFNVGEQTIFRDVANDLNATTIGMWVYLPEDLVGIRYTGDQASFAMQYQFVGGKSAETAKTIGGHFLMQDTGKNLYSETKRESTEAGRWVYMYADISGYDYVATHDPARNTGREPCFLRFYFKRLEPKKYTFYYDDFTLDYSSAVEDRDAPTITDPKYVVVDNGVGFGTVCNSNKVLFTANVADHVANNASGLNYNSAKIYVDGVALNNVTASGAAMTSEEVTLTSGQHEVIFEIADNMGTVTRNVEVLTISGNKPIWIAGHNDSGALAEYDSVYYMDLKVADASAIDSVVTEISLNHANTWELPYMTVAQGFEVKYVFEALTNSVKLTITKNEDCALTGEQTLVSIPVRVWSWPDDAYSVSSKPGLVKDKNKVTAATMSKAGGRPIAPIDLEVEYGQVTYADGSFNGYLGAFYDFFTTETKIQDQNYAWHLTHTAAAMDDKPVTCTEAGYTGRTYCDVCKSVVAWGTIIPATGHSFAITDEVLKCACGLNFTGIWTDGKEYIDGVVVPDGWNGDSYYLNGVKLTGIQMVDGFYYDFGENGICAGQMKYTGKFFNEAANGYCYAIQGELANGWQLIDDSWNYFRWTEKTAITGTYKFASGACAGITYVFDETGNLTDGVWHTREDGNIQYFYGPDCYHWDNNMLQEIDGKTYCFDKDGYLYRGWQIVKIGAFAQQHLYHFDDVTGELLEAFEDHTGIVIAGENGYYLVDGIVQRSLGMITVDNAQYYVRGNGLLARGKFYIGPGYTGCGHLTPGYYDFGEDGKFIGTWVDTSLNGILRGDDGALHYYVNGEIQKSLGMIEVDGAQYYVRGNGLIAVGKYYIGAGYIGCGHLTPGYYDFGEDGKFAGTWVDTSLNGILAGDDGQLHYYVNGEIQKSLGMITVDGAQYYVRGNGLIAVGKYYIGAGYTGCGHLAPGYYDFGEDGKFVGSWVDTSLNGVLTGDDGALHYYVNGEIQKSLGMITVDGFNYYVRGNGLIAVGKYYIGAGYTGCGHLTPGYYDFGEDGKFVGPWAGTGINGIQTGDDGELHYYVNGEIQKSLGMITVDGAQYYVRGNGLVAVGKYYIGAGYTGCGHLTPGFYDFGEDGKFVGPWSE